MKQVTEPITEKTSVKIKNALQSTEKSTPIVNRTSFEDVFYQKTGKKFNEFYKKYYPKLVWQIKKINIDTLDAEDIANKAFMHSLEKIEMYDNRWAYSTWLFDMAKNFAYQYKNQQAKTILIESINDDSSDDDESFSALQYYLNNVTKCEDDHKDIEDYEKKLQIKYKLTLRCISQLKEKYKTIIELCDIYGKSYKEICDITSLPMQTVKNRLHHGRLKIEESLKKEFEYINKISDTSILV